MSDDIAKRVYSMKSAGHTKSDIAEALGIEPDDVQALAHQGRQEKRNELTDWAKRLRSAGHSHSAIGRALGINESVVRELFRAADQKTSTEEAVAKVLTYLRKKHQLDSDAQARGIWETFAIEQQIETIQQALRNQ